MKNLIFLLGIICLASCSNDTEVNSEQDKNQVVMHIEDFKCSDPVSRTILETNGSGAIFKWTEGDTVGIFPNEGTQVAFPVMNGTGSTTATFSGGAWALKSSSRYAAYYPFIKRLDFDGDKIPVNYLGQVQDGKNPTAAQGRYDFLTAAAVAPESGKTVFNFKHLGSIIRFDITVPHKGSLTSLALTCNEPVFTTKGTYDLLSQTPDMTPAITPLQKSETMKIDLKNINTSKDNEVVSVYLTVAPVNLEGKNVTATFVNNDTPQSVDLQLRNYLAGHSYKEEVKMKIEEKVNFINVDDVTTALPQFAIPVNLTNSSDIVAFQFDYYFPAGKRIDIMRIEPGPERLTSDHVISHNVIEDGKCRVICHSVNNTVIKGNKGTLLKIKFQSFPANGSFEMFIKDIVLVDANQTRITAPNISFLYHKLK